MKGRAGERESDAEDEVRAPVATAPAPSLPILELQRSAGNAAVARAILARKGSSQTPVQQSPGGEFRGPGLDGQEAVINPRGKKLHDVMSELLGGPGAATANEWTIYELADALGAGWAGRWMIPMEIVGGDHATIVRALDEIETGLGDAIAERSDGEPPDTVYVRSRIKTLRDFMANRAAEDPASPGAVSSRRQLVVAIAASQIGAVNDRVSGGKDPDDKKGRDFRRGHENLNEYFATAFGGYGKGRHTSSDLAHHMQKKHDPATDPLAEWCGIFVLWVYRSAGVAIGSHRTGSGASSWGGMKQRGNTKDVRPGDLAYVAKAEHHFLVADVLPGGRVKTIEANSNDQGSNTGGGIRAHERAVTELLAVYTPADLAKEDPAPPAKK